MGIVCPRLRRFLVGVAAAVSTAGAASFTFAGSVLVDVLGGAVQMNSREVPGVFGGPGSPVWDGTTLALVHDDLHDSGITTDRVVTLVLLDTDRGLAFAALVDDNTQEGTGDRLDSQLGMTSTAPLTSARFIHDNNEDIQNHIDHGNQTQTASGHFTWDADRRGDGFSWANLTQGDYVSFNFTRNGPDFLTHPGLRRTDTFQFVSWNGTAWEVVANGNFTNNNQFAFSFVVIPLPASLLVGLAGLGAVALGRRRSARVI